eukprot:NODE_490_length_6857_cov_0.383249.p2 type:complete len:368 gc:universal NODE_490_length_6857_cov_0.383249:4038-2935(-)
MSHHSVTFRIPTGSDIISLIGDLILVQLDAHIFNKLQTTLEEYDIDKHYMRIIRCNDNYDIYCRELDFLRDVVGVMQQVLMDYRLTISVCDKYMYRKVDEQPQILNEMSENGHYFKKYVKLLNQASQDRDPDYAMIAESFVQHACKWMHYEEIRVQLANNVKLHPICIKSLLEYFNKEHVKSNKKYVKDISNMIYSALDTIKYPCCSSQMMCILDYLTENVKLFQMTVHEKLISKFTHRAYQALRQDVLFVLLYNEYLKRVTAFYLESKKSKDQFKMLLDLGKYLDHKPLHLDTVDVFVNGLRSNVPEMGHVDENKHTGFDLIWRQYLMNGNIESLKKDAFNFQFPTSIEHIKIVGWDTEMMERITQ